MGNRIHLSVKDMRKSAGACALLAMVTLLLSVSSGLQAQSGQAPSGKDEQKAVKPTGSGTTRLQIEVTGGEPKKPVVDASVYVKFTEDRVVLRDRRVELNLKTNQNGLARSPEIPQGRVLIQIVAPGWKTFGRWYDVAREEQVIQIHLERPTIRWF